MSDISLSVMWSQDRYTTIEDFITDITNFGFTQIELTSTLSKEELNQLLTLSNLRISSIHAPCSPSSLSKQANPDNPPLSSLNQRERREAVSLTKSTIRFASRIGAEAVVLHLGFVPLGSKLKEKLTQLQKNPNQNEDIKEKIEQERFRKAKPYVQAAKRSLHELITLASTEGVKIGIETRDSFHEIPQLDEMEEIFTQFKTNWIGYWHDIGHAEKNSRLNFTSHREWFSKFNRQMIGVHLHDIVEMKDHYPPGIGDMDWDFIAHNLPKGVIKVCELGKWNQKEEVKKAVPFLKKKGILD